MRAQVATRLLITLAIAGCAHAAPRDTAPRSPDEQLVTSIRRAVVARTPSVDTTARGGLPMAALARANIVADPAHPAEVLDLAHARAIVYWERPIPSHDAPIVGAQTTDEGAASVFFGIVLPP